MRHLDRPLPSLGRRAALVVLPLLVSLALPLTARSSSHARAARWCSDDADGFRWAVIDGKSGCMSESLDGDVRAALAREARASGRPVLWLRVDGRDWVVRDRALVDRAEGLLQPMCELGEQMGALGGEMGKLGAQQGRRGAEIGRLAGRQAALDVRLALAGWTDDDALTDRERLELARERLELARERLELKRERARAERSQARAEMKELEGHMGDLGRRMGEMGRRMRELGERAEREMRALAREAISARKSARLDGSV